MIAVIKIEGSTSWNTTGDLKKSESKPESVEEERIDAVLSTTIFWWFIC